MSSNTDDGQLNVASGPVTLDNTPLDPIPEENNDSGAPIETTAALGGVRWSTRPIFVAKEDTWLRARMPDYNTTKGAPNPRSAQKLFINTTYHAFCAEFPQRYDVEKARQARVALLRGRRKQAEKEAAKAARLQAGTDNAADVAPESDTDTDDTDAQETTKKKAKRRKTALEQREGDPEPALLDRIRTFYRNKTGTIRHDGSAKPATRGTLKKIVGGRRKPSKPQALMNVLGDEYNERISQEFRKWINVTPKSEHVSLVTYRQMRAMEDLKTASPETLAEVEAAVKRAPGAKTTGVPVFDVDEGTAEEKEAGRIQKAQFFEDNICTLESVCVKLANDFYAQTGMLCNINFVGPRPSLGGKLSVFTFNTHVPGDPRTFSNTYGEYRDHVSLPLIEFGRGMFTPDMRSAVSLVQNADVTPEPANATPGTATPGAAKMTTGTPRATTSTIDLPPPAYASAHDSDSSREEEDSDTESETRSRRPAGLDASPSPVTVPGAPPAVDARKNQEGNLTPYEQKRADAIARNKMLVAELGLKDAAKNMFSGSASGSDAATPATKPKPKPCMKKTTTAPAEARITRAKANTEQAVTSTSQSNAPPVCEQQDALTETTQTSSAKDPAQPATTSEESPALGDASTRETSLDARHGDSDTTETANPASDRPFVVEMAGRLDKMVDSDEEPRWPVLVQRYTDLEKKFGYPRKLYTNFQLPQEGRPTEIGWWIARKRVTTNSPEIPDAQLYCNTSRKYYVSLQPEWRRSSWPPKKEDVPANETWDNLLHVGRNGIISLIAMLGWWWQSAEDREDLLDFEIILDDLIWVMGEMVVSGKLKENARDAPVDGREDRKRKRTRR